MKYERLKKRTERDQTISPSILSSTIQDYRECLENFKTETLTFGDFSWHTIRDIGRSLLEIEKSLETMKSFVDIGKIPYGNEILNNVNILRNNYDKYVFLGSHLGFPYKKSHRKPIENILRYSDLFLANLGSSS